MSDSSTAAVPLLACDANGERARIAQMFECHADRLFRLALRMSADRDVAHDLVQEAFLRVACKPHAVPDGGKDQEAWLVRVLVNLCRDRFRRLSTRRKAPPDALPVPTAAGDPEGAAVARATVVRALQSLSARRRVIVILHELEEKTVADVAALLGLRAVTIRWHLSRARRELACRLGAGPATPDATHDHSLPENPVPKSARPPNARCEEREQP